MIEVREYENKVLEDMKVELENTQFIAAYLAAAMYAGIRELKDDAYTAYTTLDISPAAKLLALETCIKGLVKADHSYMIDTFVMKFLNIQEQKEGEGE